MDTLENIIRDAHTASIENLLERLTEIGHCPCIVFDDNGQWAVSSDGIQNIRQHNDDEYYATLFIPANMFKNTIREALISYIEALSD